jgi:hypothetical protein
METLDEGIERANDVARKARILRIGTDLMKVYMDEAGPRISIALQCAMLAGQGDDDRDAISIIMSTALGICGNTINCVMGMLEDAHPKLREKFKQAFPSVLEALQHDPENGTVMMMDGNGKMKDEVLASELEAMFAERYGVRRK